jgi:hypothetical protein
VVASDVLYRPSERLLGGLAGYVNAHTAKGSTLIMGVRWRDIAERRFFELLCGGDDGHLGAGAARAETAADADSGGLMADANATSGEPRWETKAVLGLGGCAWDEYMAGTEASNAWLSAPVTAGGQTVRLCDVTEELMEVRCSAFPLTRADDFASL